ncbi:regulatory protein GemA [Paracoccaceae bacterium GXU_MW_L88]
MSYRNKDLATIHIAAKALFGDVGRKGDGRAAYEDWMERHTGKRSAGALTSPERVEFIKHLRREGLIPERQRGGNGPDRPTSAQWAKLGGLARSMGWEKGLEDPRLKAFVTRTAKVSSTRFLSRQKASQVILGLEQWVKAQAAKDGGADAVS